MNLQSDTTPAQMPEPLRYARWLEWGTRIGSILLALSFAAYLAGWLPPRVPVQDLPALWHADTTTPVEAALNWAMVAASRASSLSAT